MPNEDLERAANREEPEVRREDFGSDSSWLTATSAASEALGELMVQLNTASVLPVLLLAVRFLRSSEVGVRGGGSFGELRACTASAAVPVVGDDESEAPPRETMSPSRVVRKEGSRPIVEALFKRLKRTEVLLLEVGTSVSGLEGFWRVGIAKAGSSDAIDSFIVCRS